MTVLKMYRKNKIALFLAVILMFCGVYAGGVMAFELPGDVLDERMETVFERPKAGEFFAGSLARAERQSVRQITSEWQGIARAENQRSFWQQYKLKEARAFLTERGDFWQRIYSERKRHESTAIPLRKRQTVIVCYIHNQDGAKG